MPEDALAEKEATRIGLGLPKQAMAGRDPEAEEARAAEEGEAQRTHQINETGHADGQNGRDIRQTHEDLVDFQHAESSNGAVPSQSQRSAASKVGHLDSMSTLSYSNCPACCHVSAVLETHVHPVQVLSGTLWHKLWERPKCRL